MDFDLGLEEQSRLFGQLVRSTSDILWMFSGDWEELIFVNDQYEEIWGRSIGALKEHPTDFLEGIHPADRDEVRDAMTQLSDGEGVELEFRVHADEDYGRWVWVHGEPITDEDDEVVRVAGFARDVTERKARERDLRRSEQRYRQLLEISPAPIFIYTTDSELVYANEAALEFLAADDRDAILGTTAGDFTHPESRDDIDTRLERLVEDREPVPPLEETLVDTTGATKHAIMASAPVTYEDEPATQTVATDITEQKRRERELERQNERLDAFSTLLSHDLRNPLNVAEGRLELARAECESDHLDSIARAHERMETLVEDLLLMARTGEAVENPEPVDLGRLAETSWETVETATATLATEINRPIRADENRLRQLFENLFRNAVDHAGSDVTMTVGDLDSTAGFFVADDGPGIPPAERDEVFELGHSLADDGTGIGLAIVREIANAHDWDVDVTESGDGGTRFEFTGVEFVHD